MATFFDSSFEQDLTAAVQDIESVSKVEVVAVIKEQSDAYMAIPVQVSLITFCLTFIYFMFTPMVFSDGWIISGCIGGAALTYLLCSFGGIKGWLASKSAKNRNVEVKARAIFQKAGVRHTQDEIGLLIYGSLIEKKVYLVADRGIEKAYSENEMAALTTRLEGALVRGPESFIKELETLGEFFADKLPIEEDDVNELPDYIEVDI